MIHAVLPPPIPSDDLPQRVIFSEPTLDDRGVQVFNKLWLEVEMDDPMEISRFLVIVGIVLVAAGLLWPFLSKIGLGRLPGDIVIERDNFRLYVPIMTSLIISLVLSLILWLLGR